MSLLLPEAWLFPELVVAVIEHGLGVWLLASSLVV